MSKKKGLSFEEKRTRMLELFHEKKEPFLLKELEKLGPKLKGVVMQSVKEIVQSLVADDLVETDKIGSSTYFWSFPSKALNSVTTPTIAAILRLEFFHLQSRRLRLRSLFRLKELRALTAKRDAEFQADLREFLTLDNVFLVKSWCKEKFNLEDAELNKQFDIPEDFDYPE
ncbi:unnamed protein product [Medioppia subpectinata]|uniref:Meiotic nuclear division protein 1 homolog n=1 Tax=Medioppia subpectinata TaxID=1979941 RepID=A0A7R9PWF1_9ACAR|nr:unnamed protein product [Medioppia subpectinata]CAG2103260.1 unnamed protein product [Medioppia subpectinata]